MNRQLTINEIAHYFPYGLEVSYNDCIYRKNHIALLSGVSYEGIETTYKRKFKGCKGDYISYKGNNNIADLNFKPILYPLSSLTKQNIKEFYRMDNVDIELINWEEWAKELIHLIQEDYPFQLQQWEYLYSRHFDLKGLIESGLAIDKTTL